MFQSPLYYLLSAPLYSFLLHFFEPPTVGKLLRIVPLLCGAAQVEVSYRGLRRVFPERNDLQVLGTILGGLLPMNLYLSQGLGNEPLAGLLSGILIVFAFRFLESPSGRSPGATMAMGLFLGLALLTKVTAALLIPPLLMVLAGSSWRRISLTVLRVGG